MNTLSPVQKLGCACALPKEIRADRDMFNAVKSTAKEDLPVAGIIIIPRCMCISSVCFESVR